MIKGIAKQKKISLDFVHAEKHFIHGEQVILSRILINLLSNAIKFTPENGHVKVVLDTKLESLTQINVVIKVIDSGVGMNAETVANLFKAYTQADSSPTIRAQGTGLGLFNSKQLAHCSLRGHLIVDSSPDKGSTFTLSSTWQVATAEEIAQLQESEKAVCAKPMTPPTLHLVKSRRTKSRSSGFLAGINILIVEDNIVNLMLLENYLKDPDFKGSTYKVAKDGKDAVTKCAEFTFKIVFMDCELPVLDGYEATRQIRARENECGLTHALIIGSSANSSADDKAKAIKAGMNAYLSKPYSSSEMLNIIRQTIQAHESPLLHSITTSRKNASPNESEPSLSGEKKIDASKTSNCKSGLFALKNNKPPLEVNNVSSKLPDSQPYDSIVELKPHKASVSSRNFASFYSRCSYGFEKAMPRSSSQPILSSGPESSLSF